MPKEPTQSQPAADSVDLSIDEVNNPKHAGGRPLKFDTVKKLDAAIKKYFRSCEQRRVKKVDWVQARTPEGKQIRDENGQLSMVKLPTLVTIPATPPTISGLAHALGISRQTILNYHDRPEFLDSIERAKQFCEAFAESQLFGPAANGAKFNLINNYRGGSQPWADKQEIDHTTKGQAMPLLGGTTPMVDEDDDGAAADDIAQEDPAAS